MSKQTAFEQVAERLSQPDGRVVVLVGQGGCRHVVLSPADLPNLKAEGSGIRHGKLYYFACQLRFARAA